MNNKDDKVIKKESINKKTTTSSKFKRIKGPKRLLVSILSNFKQKDLYKLPSFWFANAIFCFFTIKLIQLGFFINQFAVAIPREEGINNLMYLDGNMIKGMKTEVLFKYLDDLEKQKNERKSNFISNKNI
jgi:hypothetical protein